MDRPGKAARSLDITRRPTAKTKPSSSLTASRPSCVSKRTPPKRKTPEGARTAPCSTEPTRSRAWWKRPCAATTSATHGRRFQLLRARRDQRHARLPSHGPQSARLDALQRVINTRPRHRQNYARNAGTARTRNRPVHVGRPRRSHLQPPHSQRAIIAIESSGSSFSTPRP